MPSPVQPSEARQAFAGANTVLWGSKAWPSAVNKEEVHQGGDHQHCKQETKDGPALAFSKVMGELSPAFPTSPMFEG